MRDETAEELATLQQHFPKPIDAVSYIMETFPIVKRKDIKHTEQTDDTGTITQKGHYRTKTRILELYTAMLQARQQGTEWQSPLEIPPASFQNAHPPKLPGSEREGFAEAADVWNQFLVQFIRQTGSEATLSLLSQAWHRFADLSRYPTELSANLSQEELATWNQSNPPSHQRDGFSNYVTQAISAGLISYNNESLVLSLADQALGSLPTDDWVSCDVALALGLLTRDPGLEKWLPRTITNNPEKRAAILTEYSLAG